MKGRRPGIKEQVVRLQQQFSIVTAGCKIAATIIFHCHCWVQAKGGVGKTGCQRYMRLLASLINGNFTICSKANGQWSTGHVSSWGQGRACWIGIFCQKSVMQSLKLICTLKYIITLARQDYEPWRCVHHTQQLCSAPRLHPSALSRENPSADTGIVKIVPLRI